jgi:hypothetical protein
MFLHIVQASNQDMKGFLIIFTFVVGLIVEHDKTSLWMITNMATSQNCLFFFFFAQPLRGFHGSNIGSIGSLHSIMHTTYLNPQNVKTYMNVKVLRSFSTS